MAVRVVGLVPGHHFLEPIAIGQDYELSDLFLRIGAYPNTGGEDDAISYQTLQRRGVVAMKLVEYTFGGKSIPILSHTQEKQIVDNLESIVGYLETCLASVESSIGYLRQNLEEMKKVLEKAKEVKEKHE